MAHRRGAAGGYLKATRTDLRPQFHDRTSRDRRDRRCDGPNLLCRSRHRQGPSCGSVQDHAAGGRRLLSRLTRGESGFAQALGISAMADRLAAEQNLKNFRTCSPSGAAGFDFDANKITTRMVDLTRKFDVLVI